MPSDITNLPIELIDLIFGHLTMANDRRRAAQVCKLFNKVIRSQSIRNRDNTLTLVRSLFGESPFRVFEDWECLPFSKLVIRGSTWTRNIVMESEFWSVHGHEISEIILHIDSILNKEKSLMTILSNFFPNLKRLKILECTDYKSDIDPKLQNTLNCSLPIQELDLCFVYSPEAILTVLHCSPHLKKLKINLYEPELMPKILPWLESVEASYLNYVDMPLAKLINLPSKVVIGSLTIRADEKPEMIREFFKRPRVIQKLYLKRQDENSEFNQNEEEGENNLSDIFFTRDQVEALSGAKSIKTVELFDGVLDFAGSLDCLAQLPGVESISLDLTWHRPDQLYPLYWSSPETAKKITKIVHNDDSALDYLDGLSSLTSFSDSSDGLSSDDIQHLIRNCSNLKELQAEKILANDADLNGIANRLPISFLHQLECLDIESAPNITSEALKSAFKFPNLKEFSVPYFHEEPFNQHDATCLAQNCPNLEYIKFRVSSMKEEAFEYLIRNLPYLRTIQISAKDTSLLNEEKVKAMRKEFPYLNIGIDSK